MRKALIVVTLLYAQTASAQNPLAADVDRLSAELNPQVVAWRRDFHKNPELGNSEIRTSKIIADELRKLGSK
jgi:amidohydrolase